MGNDTDGFALTAHPRQSQGRPPKKRAQSSSRKSGLPNLRSPTEALSRPLETSPAADYLIAAAAAERGAGVLHYDHHFDTLCSALGIDSVWIAKPGSMD